MKAKRETALGRDLSAKVEGIIQESRRISIREFSQRKRQNREREAFIRRLDDEMLEKIEFLAECKGTMRAIADLLGFAPDTIGRYASDSNEEHIPELRDAIWRGRAVMHFRNSAKQISEAMRGNTRMLEVIGDAIMPHEEYRRELQDGAGKIQTDQETRDGILRDIFGKIPMDALDALGAIQDREEDGSVDGPRAEFEH